VGHYRHPSTEPTTDPVDDAFQGFGSTQSNAQGQLRFRTIKPVPYPGRTPHIHVKLRHATFGDVTSQLFVAGDPGNARDGLWRWLSASDRAPLEMKLEPAATDTGLRWLVRHDLVVPA